MSTRLIHYALSGGGGRWGAVADDGTVSRLAADRETGKSFLTNLLQWPDPAAAVRQAMASGAPQESVTLEDLLANRGGALVAPIDRQEVWAAGVTYLRSKEARMQESEGAARFYDAVYDAERPEIFFKATPNRVSGPGQPIRIREDARWNVPEPEVALLITPRLQIVGYTVGNDVSSRDIEGENPLYLPQAKLYSQSCALGPTILLEEASSEHRELDIALEITRDGRTAFSGTTSSGRMKRQFQDLVNWLGKDNDFPQGAFLLTGTGLVPPDEFTLEPGDQVSISIAGVGTLSNPVVRGRG